MLADPAKRLIHVLPDLALIVPCSSGAGAMMSPGMDRVNTSFGMSKEEPENAAVYSVSRRGMTNSGNAGP